MLQEHLHHHELEPRLLEAYATTFISRWDAYPWQQPDGKYIAVRKPLGSYLIEGHLKGHITLGAYALNPASMAKWVCFDADHDEQWAKLLEMAIQLEDEGFPVYRERSRRGGHVWLFTPSIPGILMRRFARQMLVEHGIDPDQGIPKPIEIYPRQTQLVDDGLGSLVRLPLGVHRKTGKVYPFVHRRDQPLADTPRELLPIMVTPHRIPLSFIMRVVARSPQEALPHPTPAFEVKSTRHLKDKLPSERILAAISTLEFIRQYVDLDAQHKATVLSMMMNTRVSM